MSDAFQLGPLLVKMSMLAAVVSLACGFLAITLRLKKEKVERAAIIELLSNAVFLAFLIWKLSYILLHFSKAIQNPSSILYFSGGENGAWLAAVAVMIYLVRGIRKKAITVHLVVLAFATGFLAASGIYHMLTVLLENSDRWFYIQQVVIHAIFLWWLFTSKQDQTTMSFWLTLSLWFGISQVYVQFFIDTRNTLFLGLSKTQIAFYLLSLLALFLSSRLQTPVTGGSSDET
ncbi:hypothetical protein BRE01_20720 [Brevibacillus reuszeri]|uniref:Uncharacterized protein n=1 Tax=Brevibacillus reuszeri TaxID=54915 RepID=A0A0K9YX57_9BACL|nr:hypothetical protein [Brevibacillus reuszeri]KNB73268.1 hypothetical protein ADS79_04690 [Brevibacillus reuszeri]MED1856880.1 hypothetical protein [Brevibacillus reuszeri]GED68370.1 hypothetical protein BRE01_20720 [Brevibacillus reuszeri]